jgi:hypothetical protein
MLWTSLASGALLEPSIHALLRFSCSQLVIERLDPLVNPGVTGSPHLHQVYTYVVRLSGAKCLFAITDHRR